MSWLRRLATRLEIIPLKLIPGPYTWFVARVLKYRVPWGIK